MKKSSTDQFSFILKPGRHGVGVFAVHGIKRGAYLRLFGDELKLGDRSVKMPIGKVPKVFQSYCLARGRFLICPKDFGAMPVGWYLNHSIKPNAYHQKLHWYAKRNIRPGEEILIDYNSLAEPEYQKEKFYSRLKKSDKIL